MQDEATMFRLEQERRILLKAQARRIYLKRKAARSLYFLVHDLIDVAHDVRDLVSSTSEWVKIWINT